MEREHLHLLIHEEIFLIKEETAPLEATPTEETVHQSVDVAVEDTPEVSAPSDAPTPMPPASDASETESTALPEEKVEASPVPIAIFHDSASETNRALLEKIITACKLEEGTYQVYASGFDKAVHFEKALVFVASAKAFYQAIPYKKSQILCSRPLDQIATDQNEKAKLWGALQTFF